MGIPGERSSRPSVALSRLLVGLAIGLDLIPRFGIWAINDFRPEVSALGWIVGLGPWVLVMAFALRDPIGAAAWLLILRACAWVVITLLVPIEPVGVVLTLDLVILAALVAARRFHPDSVRARALGRGRLDWS